MNFVCGTCDRPRLFRMEGNTYDYIDFFLLHICEVLAICINIPEHFLQTYTVLNISTHIIHFFDNQMGLALC